MGVFPRMQLHRLTRLRSEDGQTTFEYGVVAALLIALAVAVFPFLRDAALLFASAVGDALSAV